MRRWQRRVKHKGWGINAEARGLDISLPRGTPRTPTRDTPSTMPGTPVAGSPAGGLPREDGGEERKDVGTPPPRERLLLTCKGTLPPPFYWNGQATLVALATSLDFLATIPELVEWYGEGYPWTNNPFAFNISGMCRDRAPAEICPLGNVLLSAWQVDIHKRPPTPRKKTRLVRIGQDDMEMDVPRLVEGHNRDQEKLNDYKEGLFKAAPWWPGWGVTEDDRVRIRRAERDVLIATYTADILERALLKERPTRPSQGTAKPRSSRNSRNTPTAT